MLFSCCANQSRLGRCLILFVTVPTPLSFSLEKTYYTKAAKQLPIPSFRHAGNIPAFDWVQRDCQAVVHLASSC